MEQNDVICGYNYFYAESVSSTNLFAGKLIKSAAESDKFFIRAGYQEQGMGQGGNGWESEADKNILGSMVLKPSGVSPENQFIITQAVSLGILSVVGNIVDRERLSVKWPNDIYYDDKKLAGILISNMISGSDIQWTIIGIGLNVNQLVFPAHVPRPVSLSLITGLVHDIDGLARDMLCAIDFNLGQVIQPVSKIKIEHEYQDNLYRLNQWADYLIGGKIIKAKILGVARYGLLELEMEGGRKEFFGFRQIEFV